MESEEKTVTVDVDESFIVKSDAGDLCRLCANTDNQLIPIFKGEGIEHSIPTKIEKHLPIIKVTEIDKLPLQICYQCASTLIAWHNLYEGCRIADTRLREILSIDDKLYQEDETFDNYVDDYRDDFDDQSRSNYETLPLSSTASTSNLPSDDILKDSTIEITQLNESKELEETELDSTDERCLRWTPTVSCDRTNVQGAEHSANILGRRPSAGGDVLSSRVISDATDSSAAYAYCCDFLMDEYDADKTWEENNGGGVGDGRRLSGMCDCVWNKGACQRCPKYDSFKCHFCPMVFLKADVRNRHLRISHRKELLKHSMAYFCGVGLVEKTGESDEAKIDRDSERLRYQCDKCERQFADKIALIEHFAEHDDDTRSKRTKVVGSRRPTPGRRKRTTVPTRSRTPALAAPVSYDCAHCAAETRTKMEMKRHLVSVHQFKIDKRGGIRERGNFKQAELTGGSFKTTGTVPEGGESAAGYYTCAECGHIFLKRHSFTRHLHQHSSSRHDCDMCKKTFNSESVLLEHRESKHKDLPKNVFYVNGRKYMKCELCSFTCRNERNKMEEHLRVHTGEKPFTCEQCGKQFRTQALLRVHRRYVHDGVKEHACDLCGRCFSNKRYMEEHRRIHTGEKPLVCDLCGKTFRQNSSLSKHVENHLGIKRHACHLCDKRFSNSHHLNIHIKRHMGEASYVCTKCGKAFVDQYQLKNHQVVHSEERPHLCLVCGMKFKLLKHLKQHGKTHRS